jgi:hypothetical protein
MASVTVTYQIPMAQVGQTIAQQVRHIEAGLNAAVDELLGEVEQAQILSYTASGNPSQPAGTRYTRTFTLQGASKTRRTSTRLPVISGEWVADEGVARYAGYVIGSRADQARIHRGRWKSTEEVEREIKQAAPAIVERNLR